MFYHEFVCCRNFYYGKMELIFIALVYQALWSINKEKGICGFFVCKDIALHKPVE